MANIMQSLVATGHTIRGVCYAKSNYLSQSIPALSAIPPERVGLNGEYDYYGLAKRIKTSFQGQVGREAVKQLTVKQRGSAVILSGQIDTLDLLDQLVDLALHTEGTTHVEVHDVQVNVLELAQSVRVA
ncbi:MULTISPECIES: phospholipid-binding protein [Cyanophyceae]|uniref:phospholipid-binding protein n=1 Tax=Cyanophyceae TaxID=3028117 RepID=UPI0016831811|nr:MULTISPECIES: phospholipid-binding protein [Cyanophyceae]MBD1915900.1 phospholipid-binding protein [Phormidium sp. FACHB-77]MBD2030426.1 phospholipid-binding protein [Phormidium sp. FACHB-322]MBD2053428.1 phospholipid-binding protein [Leptolyngbya sp. FACHB-60]